MCKMHNALKYPSHSCITGNIALRAWSRANKSLGCASCFIGARPRPRAIFPVMHSHGTLTSVYRDSASVESTTLTLAPINVYSYTYIYTLLVESIYLSIYIYRDSSSVESTRGGSLTLDPITSRMLSIMGRA